MLNEDYKDMLRALSDEKVKFLLVGAYAMAAHGYPRATGDMDIWVLPSPENAEAVLRALNQFGAPLHDLTAEDLQKEGTVFQIGVAPRRVFPPAAFSAPHTPLKPGDESRRIRDESPGRLSPPRRNATQIRRSPASRPP